MTGYRRLRLVLPATIALAPFLAAGLAQAQERGELMRDALSGIGLLEKRQDPIDYHERTPLVMPPKFDGKALPAPRARSTNAAWPKDPEAVEREREARRPPQGNQIQGRYEDNNATLSIDEMRSGRRAGAAAVTDPERRPGDGGRTDNWLNPLELLKGKSADAEPSDVEPTRDSLVQPPIGYRQAPKKVVRSSNDPVSNPYREREEADPGTYIRQRAQQ